MKILTLICAIFLSIVLAACGDNTNDREYKYEIAGSSSRVVTEAEKRENFEKHLAQRLQSTIELFDNVNVW